MKLSNRARRVCRKHQRSGNRNRIIGVIMADTGCSVEAAEMHYLDHYRVRYAHPERPLPANHRVDPARPFFLDEETPSGRARVAWLERYGIPIAGILALFGIFAAIEFVLRWLSR